MPGAGKTTIGIKLGSRVRRQFFDLDTQVENMMGISIPEIFEEYGEDYFRELERDVLYMLIRLNEPAVIATGGGAPCHLDGIDLMNKSGHTIFLNPPLDEAIDRVKNEKDKRPLLSGSNESVHKKMKDLYKKRLPYYQKASFTTNDGLEAIVQHLSSI